MNLLSAFIEQLVIERTYNYPLFDLYLSKRQNLLESINSNWKLLEMHFLCPFWLLRLPVPIDTTVSLSSSDEPSIKTKPCFSYSSILPFQVIKDRRLLIIYNYQGIQQINHLTTIIQPQPLCAKNPMRLLLSLRLHR
jgi:hypothetical protein